MSQIEKLKTLLARVEQRRVEPRLVAVSNASAPSANTNVGAMRAPAPQLELAKPSPEAVYPPSSVPPPPSPEARISSLPPAGKTPLPPPPSSTVPPAAPEPVVRTTAPTEVLPSAGQRIAPAAIAATEAPVRTTSALRSEASKSFGELLEQSLALRPKAG